MRYFIRLSSTQTTIEIEYAVVCVFVCCEEQRCIGNFGGGCKSSQRDAFLQLRHTLFAKICRQCQSRHDSQQVEEKLPSMKGVST